MLVMALMLQAAWQPDPQHVVDAALAKIAWQECIDAAATRSARGRDSASDIAEGAIFSCDEAGDRAEELTYIGLEPSPQISIDHARQMARDFRQRDEQEMRRRAIAKVLEIRAER